MDKEFYKVKMMDRDYRKAMASLLNVKLADSGVVLQLPHKPEDLTLLEGLIRATPDGEDVILRGVAVSKSKTMELLAKGEVVNKEIYYHLHDKIKEIDFSDTPEAVVWSYDYVSEITV